MGRKKIINYVAEHKDEIWRDIADYDHLYQVSSYGFVRRMPYTIFVKNGNRRYTKNSDIRYLNIFLDDSGYPTVNIRKNDQPFRIRIHRLVAFAFLEQVENKKFINHIDGDKQNNCYTNLEWCTPKENSNHAIKLGLIKFKKSYSGKKVVMLDKENNEVIAVFCNIQRALDFFNKKGCGSIWECCNSERDTAFGYRWRYYE